MRLSDFYILLKYKEQIALTILLSLVSGLTITRDLTLNAALAQDTYQNASLNTDVPSAESVYSYKPYHCRLLQVLIFGI
jgi:hypothetical protein